jgi:hypothetical protein
MNVRKSAMLTILTGALFGVTVAPASPAALPPGGSVNPVPTYNGTGTPTVTVLFDTGQQSVMENGVTVQFEEWAAS